MTKFLSADIHFGHINIIEYCGRPYESVVAMNEDIIKRWNSVVAEDDDVWFLGDLALGQLDESLLCVSRLNGVIHLVPGNHDRMFDCMGLKYANAVRRYIDAGIREVLDPRDEPIHLPILGNAPVFANHFPYRGDDTTEDRYSSSRPVDRGERLVHGHTHGAYRRSGRMIDVGVDAWGGCPVSSEEVAQCFASKHTDLPVLLWAAAEPGGACTGTK